MKKIIAILLAVSMLASFLVVPAFAEDKGYSDIKGHWAEETILTWSARGVVAGYPDGTFQPDKSISRAEFATIIANLLKLSVLSDKDFPDVAKDAWYNDEVLKVRAAGIMLGDDKGNFNPEANITREEAFVAYARLLGLGKDATPELSKFVDAANTSEWAAPEVSALASQNVVRGDDKGNLNPTAEITRAEILALLSQTKDADHIHHFVAEDGSCAICQGTKDSELKFALSVASGEAVVAMNVFNDYSAVVTVPAKNVDASKVKITAVMQNVASLGVSNKREHSIEFGTGLTATPSLATWLSSCFTFESGYVQATIDGNACVYHVTGDKNAELATLRADSTNIRATRAAWMALTAGVSTKTQEESDSYINIANGSFLQIADQKLGFETENDLKLDNFSDIEALKQNIRDNIILNTVEADKEWQIVATLKAGTALAISNSIAILDKDVTIKLKDLPAETLAKLLPDLKAAESTYAMASILMKTINEVIGAVNGTTAEKPVVVEINFAK